jgi:hypothetical protein
LSLSRENETLASAIKEADMDVEGAAKVWELANGKIGEYGCRVLAGALASGAKHGDVAKLCRAIGKHRPYVAAGLRALEAPPPRGGKPLPAGARQRRAGGGRKSLSGKTPGIAEALRGIVGRATRGDPAGPLVWTSLGLRDIAEELTASGFPVSHMGVKTLLLAQGYTLQSDRKAHGGGGGPDRNAQFEKINEIAGEFIRNGLPAVSVDAKKKEPIGEYKNAGREWRGKGTPREVEVYDFIGPSGKATPYGVYDITDNAGFVSVGVSHDTAEFAVNSIENWWAQMGRASHPGAKAVMVTADGGGSNGSRSRLWKTSLQRFCDTHGIAVCVSHFPPGTSKWNKIEHRLFSMISLNWRGKPLTSLEVVVSLIGGTTTAAGLKVACVPDLRQYRTGISVTDEEMAGINIRRNAFHPEWNYAIFPKTY